MEVKKKQKLDRIFNLKFLIKISRSSKFSRQMVNSNLLVKIKIFNHHPDSLGPLVTKVKEFQVETIVDTLCTNMISEKEQLKDISSIGLKTVINQLPSVSTPISTSIVRKITGRLLNTIQRVIRTLFKLNQKLIVFK